MNFHFLIIFTLFQCSGWFAFSQDFMNIHQSNGTLIQIPLNSIDSITYTLDAESNPGSGVTFGGYTYNTILLGNGQEWMAENLRTSIYSNGDPIQNIPDSAQWTNLTSGAWVNYFNDIQYDTVYGKLYNGFTVMDSRNVCPIGWHVPTLSEWSQLISYLDPQSDGGNNLPNQAGGKMKSIGTQYWQPTNIGATNESGFTGLPSGLRQIDASFGDPPVHGYWWSVTESTQFSNALRNIVLEAATTNVYLGDNYPNNGFAIRCIRD
jgi:uncharacterized protein (TIGR02145 family)